MRLLLLVLLLPLPLSAGRPAATAAAAGSGGGGVISEGEAGEDIWAAALKLGVMEGALVCARTRKRKVGAERKPRTLRER